MKARVVVAVTLMVVPSAVGVPVPPPEAGAALASLPAAAPSVSTTSLVTFSGVLRDGSGAPVAGNVMVTDVADPYNNVALATHADGIFSAAMRPGVYRIYAYINDGPEFTSDGGIIDLSAGDVAQDIWLPRGIPAAVQILFADGTPVAGASIELWSDATAPAEAWPGGPSGTGGMYNTCSSDSLGTCSLDVIGTQRSTDWVMSIPGSLSIYPFVLQPTEGLTSVSHTVRLPELFRFSGSLSEADGTPVPSSAVSIAGSTGGFGQAWTLADGSFELLIPSGDYTATIDDRCGDFNACIDGMLIAEVPIAVAGADVHVDMRFPQRVAVDVTVRAADGTPVAMADVRAGLVHGGQGSMIPGTATMWPGGPSASLALRANACLTDAEGQCALMSFVGAGLSSAYASPKNSSSVAFELPPIDSPSSVAVEVSVPALHRWSATVKHGQSSVQGTGISMSQPFGHPLFDRSVSIASAQSNGVFPAQCCGSLSGDIAAWYLPNEYRINIGFAYPNQQSGLASVWVDLTQGDVMSPLDVPPPVSLGIVVLDAAGSPIENAEVRRSHAEVPWTFGEGLEGRFQYSEGACWSTAADGTCTLRSFLGAPASTWNVTLRSDESRFRVPAPSVTGDGQEFVVRLDSYVSIPSSGSVDGTLSIASSGDATLADVSVAPVSSGTLGGNESAVIGELTYSVDVANPGDGADVTLSLPAGSLPTRLYKSVNGQLVDVTSLATISGDTVTLHVVDGGAGDEDGVANGVIVDPVIPVRATNPLTVMVAGGVGGTVHSDKGGITCGTDCSQTYRASTAVTLTAVPPPGLAFLGWSGSCSGLSTCTVSMAQARAVTATFGSGVALTVTKSGPGIVSSDPAGIRCGYDCTRSFPSGAQVRLTATPATGYAFAGWSGACTGTGPCTVSMKRARSVSASFVPGVALSVAVVGAGTVTSNPAGISCTADCTGYFVSGSSVTLTAQASSGFVFGGWSGACTGSATCTVAMSAARSVTATFVEGRVLTVSKVGLGTVTSSPGGISCGTACTATYSNGANVALSAVPATGSVFVGWSGACSGTGLCVVSMTQARSVTATFAPTYVLTVTKRGKGTVTSTPGGISCGSICSAGFASGTVVELVAVPVSGSRFLGWSGACSGTSVCRVTITQATAVTANFGR